MIDWIKELFEPPPAEVLAAKMLAEHRRRLLEAQEAESYAHQMVAHHMASIARLQGEQ